MEYILSGGKIQFHDKLKLHLHTIRIRGKRLTCARLCILHRKHTDGKEQPDGQQIIDLLKGLARKYPRPAWVNFIGWQKNMVVAHK